MDFSGRQHALYVSLGRGMVRRRVLSDDDGTTDIERFLGTRLHGFATIVRVDRGNGLIFTAGGGVPIEAGQIAALPSGVVGYAFAGARRAETLALPVHLEVGRIVRSTDVPADLFERSDAEIVDLLREAPAVTHIARRNSERTAMDALQRLDVGPLSARLQTVAHDLGYTADGLTALLVRYTGTGFAAWRDALAMAHVRSALALPQPFVRIARRLELEPTYLHRRFARSHGTSPTRWRNEPTLPRLALAHDWDSVLRYFPSPSRSAP